MQVPTSVEAGDRDRLDAESVIRLFSDLPPYFQKLLRNDEAVDGLSVVNAPIRGAAMPVEARMFASTACRGLPPSARCGRLLPGSVAGQAKAWPALQYHNDKLRG